ncbi:MAG: radical SAM protein [Bacteroidales bacterium]|nr:radical SAM protein [Bacteroidales bacterium]
MKILLISPATSKEFLHTSQVRREPLGLCYISAISKKYNHQSIIIDQIDRPDEFIINKTIEYKPDIIGFSVMTYNYPKGLLLSKRIKSEYKDVPIVFGGTHPSGMPEIILENSIDYVIKGEGEDTFIELIDCLENKTNNLEIIKGLVYKENGLIKNNGCRKRLSDLKQLPMPDRIDLPMNKYRAFSLNWATIHSVRGCRNNCSFCSTPITWKGKITSRTTQSVINEIYELITKYKVKGIFFADEDFFYDQERIFQLCDEIKKSKLKFVWKCFANLSDINNLDILKKIKESGCLGPMIGIESFNNAVLERINRKSIDFLQIKRQFNQINSIGLITWVTYMIGYPYESYSELSSSLNTLEKLSPDFSYFNYVTPFPGTKFYEECTSKKWLTDFDFSNYNCLKPVIQTNLHIINYELFKTQLHERFNIGKYHSKQIRFYYKLFKLQINNRTV